MAVEVAAEAAAPVGEYDRCDMVAPEASLLGEACIAPKFEWFGTKVWKVFWG